MYEWLTIYCLDYYANTWINKELYNYTRRKGSLMIKLSSLACKHSHRQFTYRRIFLMEDKWIIQQSQPLVAISFLNMVDSIWLKPLTLFIQRHVSWSRPPYQTFCKYLYKNVYILYLCSWIVRSKKHKTFRSSMHPCRYTLHILYIKCLTTARSEWNKLYLYWS